jgi:hypothetical protein
LKKRTKKLLSVWYRASQPSSTPSLRAASWPQSNPGAQCANPNVFVANPVSLVLAEDFGNGVDRDIGRTYKPLVF